MRVRFWGTRGSIPKPGAAMARYGGNTSCVEVRTARGTVIVLDCGSGAHDLGASLLADGGSAEGHLLISHTHWDHIQGLPFFEPLFEPGSLWHIYGPRGLSSSIRDTLAGQMEYSYFPISLDQFNAAVHYHDLVEGSFEIEEVQVTACYLNHPAMTLGYRLEADGVTLVYATDHEPHGARVAPYPEPTGEAERHAAFLADADLLIHDAQYTNAEYRGRVGWGHSPYEFVVDTARSARVRRLALFHHDPRREDVALDMIVKDAELRAGPALEVFGAAEGSVLEIEPARSGRLSEQTAAPPAHTHPLAKPMDRAVLLALGEGDAARTLAEAAQADGLQLLEAHDAESVLELTRSRRPSLVILPRRLGDRDALELCRELRDSRPSALDDPPVVVVTDSQADVDLEGGEAAGITDWLVWPFKSTYARTRMRCWLLRLACRWAIAPLPADEEERLRALHELGILDTAPEIRFDRYTRIAAALFDVPIALVSLVDSERQWFKSHHGLDVSETPREMAFCAHSILGNDVLMITDALRDPRFADNPLVTGPPHVRFYAGIPLQAGDARRVGTLCLIDHRRHRLDELQLELLRDLGKLVELELAAGARD